MSPQCLFKSVAQTSFTALLSYGTFSSFVQKLVQSNGFRFVTVVYDDFCGIKRPIGLIHTVSLGGQEREVLTYCAPGKKQPGTALFVKRRTGNLADEVALTFENQDLIPAWLKRLPCEYSHAQIAACCGA